MEEPSAGTAPIRTNGITMAPIAPSMTAAAFSGVADPAQFHVAWGTGQLASRAQLSGAQRVRSLAVPNTRGTAFRVDRCRSDHTAGVNVCVEE